MKRWAIYIDLEGVSKIYETDETQVLRGLGALATGIYQIGTTICAETPNRLFVHQTGGDGFIIVSEFAQGRPDLPVGIAVILMRLALLTGCLGKAGISEGEFADIRGCYPPVIRDHIDDTGVVRLGRGIMRLFPVMGTALIHAHQITTRARGSVLLLDPQMASDLCNATPVRKRGDDFVAVDWIHADTSAIREIASIFAPSIVNSNDLERRLVAAVENAGAAVHKDWIENTLTFNGCSVKTPPS